MQNLTLQVRGVPEDTIVYVQKFVQHLNEEYGGTQDNEVNNTRLNMEIQEFEQMLKEMYQDDFYYDMNGNFIPRSESITCKLIGNNAYKIEEWEINKIKRVYKEYYPERYVEKEKYTRLEVNNMLFNLELIDILGAYEQVAIPDFCSVNDEIFHGRVTVRCRYNIMQRRN